MVAHKIAKSCHSDQRLYRKPDANFTLTNAAQRFGSPDHRLITGRLSAQGPR